MLDFLRGSFESEEEVSFLPPRASRQVSLSMKEVWSVSHGINTCVLVLIVSLCFDSVLWLACVSRWRYASMTHLFHKRHFSCF